MQAVGFFFNQTVRYSLGLSIGLTELKVWQKSAFESFVMITYGFKANSQCITLQAVLVSLVKVLIGIPANHWVCGVVVDGDSWVILLVLSA